MLNMFTVRAVYNAQLNIMINDAFSHTKPRVIHLIAWVKGKLQMTDTQKNKHFHCQYEQKARDKF